MEYTISTIPRNYEGKPVDIEKSIIEPSIAAADETFKRACNRLRHPDLWQHMPGFSTSSFHLHKSNQQSLLADEAEVGDYISIDVPGPGPANGDGNDWVQVEYLQENFDDKFDASCSMRVRTSINPNNNKEQGTVAHFFKDMATSTFIIRRKKKKITASYHGRNEVPNLKYTNIHDKIRNAVVAFIALAGFSEMQWTLFLNGLLNTRNK